MPAIVAFWNATEPDLTPGKDTLTEVVTLSALIKAFSSLTFDTLFCADAFSCNEVSCPEALLVSAPVLPTVGEV